MSVVAFLQELLDAGLPLEAAMTAARIHEAQVMSARLAPSAGAERTRRWRERKASQSVTERHEASHVTEGDNPSLPLPPSPQTPQPPTPTHPDITPRARKGVGSADFDAFWRAYPKKKSKDVAAKAFAKAMRRIPDADPLAVILAGIERALPGWDDVQFIPYPATWLNAAGWEDEAPTPAKPAQRARNERPDAHRPSKLDHLDDIARAMAASRHGTVEPDRGDRFDPGAEGRGRYLPPAA